MSDTCFVIQPFDGGRFDKLFEDTFDPAIRDAGLLPYRVDRDPSTSIPIDEIEKGIRNAAVCLVDLTLDNPNVWFELGFSIAERKDLCLVSSNSRTKYPFDVQHRTIISYASDSPRDFEELKKKISGRIRAIMKKQENIDKVSLREVTVPRAGLKSHEIACLATIASEVSGLGATITNYSLKKEMEKAGFNSLAVHVAINALSKASLVSREEATDQDGDRYEYYALTATGWDWITSNVERLDLTAASGSRRRSSTDRSLDDEIPF